MKTMESPIVKLERGIPLPPRGEMGKYPWKAMKVGDSFVADAGIRGGFYSTAQRHGYKVRVKSIGDGKVRVWRLE